MYNFQILTRRYFSFEKNQPADGGNVDQNGRLVMHEKMSVMINYGWHYAVLITDLSQEGRWCISGLSRSRWADLPKAKVGGQSQSSSFPDEMKLKVYYHGNSCRV
jgi:hypothetical protein